MKPSSTPLRPKLRLLVSCALAALLVAGCNRSETPGNAPATPAATGQVKTIGVAFETLQTEFWVAAFDKLKADCAAKGITMLEAVADGDTGRQFDQVKTFIRRKVDGVIIAPRDGKTVIPMIKACNAANIPVVLFNRPADPTEARHTAVAPDNFAITRDTVRHLVSLARKSGRKQKAMILVGDLSDGNAIGRRDGFEAAMQEAGDAVEVVARVPTEWNQEKALAGVRSAMQAHPDIGLIFTSSDFMFPSIKSVLANLGKWKRHDEPGHVILGGFDGDATAYQLMVEGYVDATGVQDVFWEAEQAIQAILDARAGKPVPARIDDKGFAITQENLKEMAGRMWGAVVAGKRK
ncbi:MAG TPA: sugar ABC transporter substrate-binding protein [Methylomirabilota bacterium]|nr:sugar ABC transporter substrate-binding protein [Methylomirabilota bacterium]